MDQLVNPARCCPECGSREYVVRGRKYLPLETERPPPWWSKHVLAPGVRPCKQLKPL
jgi:hypothetical protein